MPMNRKDAKRIKLPALMQCCIDLKPRRADNTVYINRKMDVTELVDYIGEKKAQGENITYFYAFMAAIGRVIYNRPKLNRFITNRHLYEHNKVTLAFVAKMTLNDSAEELMLVQEIAPEDNLATLAGKLGDKVHKLREKASVKKKGANSATDGLSLLPNPIRIPIFGLIKWADKHGLLPASLCRDNIYYSSMIVSNLGSIGCGAIYHNLADFGTSSSLTTMGEIVPTQVVMPDGSVQIRQLCEFGMTLDERIGDGFYFAKSCKMIEYLLSHPKLLEERADAPLVMEGKKEGKKDE